MTPFSKWPPAMKNLDEESNDEPENPYDSWLTLNSKWLQPTPREITVSAILLVS